MLPSPPHPIPPTPQQIYLCTWPSLLPLFSNMCLSFQFLSNQCNLNWWWGHPWEAECFHVFQSVVTAEVHGRTLSSHVPSWRTGVLTSKWPPKHITSLSKKPRGCLLLSVPTASALLPTSQLLPGHLPQLLKAMQIRTISSCSQGEFIFSLVTMLSVSFLRPALPSNPSYSLRNHSPPTGPLFHSMPATFPSHQQLHTLRSL